MTHSDGCRDAQPACRWWCPVHEKHHPVANMVTDCEERSTAPD